MAKPDYEHEARQAYEASCRSGLTSTAENHAAIASAAASLALLDEIKLLRADLAALRKEPR